MSYFSRFFLASVTALTLTTLSPSLEACTGIKLIAKNEEAVHGRTLEFGVDVEISLVVVPRAHPFKGTLPEGTAGLSYTTKYATVGTIAYGNMAVMDGINEKGLSAGIFYFPGFADYTAVTHENQSKALAPVEFVNWILTQFATLEEVKKALSDVVIVPTVSKAWGTTPPPFHYIVYEKNGNALVIEPINGKLVTYDNPLGAFSNSPTFDWHMTNLRNYINLTPWNVKPVTFRGLTFAPFGQGSGMVGLPGDFTPPSRFVRAAIFSSTALPSENAEDSVWQAFHILNQFDIPIGLARVKEGGITYTDSTLFTCVRDPNTLKYYFKSYANQSVKVIDLNKFDLNSKSIAQANTNDSNKVVDISSTLK